MSLPPSDLDLKRQHLSVVHKGALALAEEACRLSASARIRGQLAVERSMERHPVMLVSVVRGRLEIKIPPSKS